MKEYIVAVDEDVMNYEEYFVGYIRRQKELIRCGDCIHHHGYICDRLYGFQDAFNLQDYDYCSGAEPKEKKND